MRELIGEISSSCSHFGFVISQLSSFLSGSCSNGLLMSKFMCCVSSNISKSLLFCHGGKFFNIVLLFFFKLFLMCFCLCSSFLLSFECSLFSSLSLFFSNFHFFFSSFLSSDSFLLSFHSHLFSDFVSCFLFFQFSFLICDLLSLFFSLSDKFLSGLSSFFSLLDIFLRLCKLFCLLSHKFFMSSLFICNLLLMCFFLKFSTLCLII
jgi:hypothetical protein